MRLHPGFATPESFLASVSSLHYYSFSVADDLYGVLSVKTPSPGLCRVPPASVALPAQPDLQVSPDVLALKDPQAQLEKRADR